MYKRTCPTNFLGVKNYLLLPVLGGLLLGAACSKKKDANPASNEPAPVVAGDKDQLVLKLLSLTGGKESAEQVINQLAANLPQAEMARLLKEVDIDEMMTSMTGIYSKRFTTGELQDIIAFYETPDGRAIAKKRPAIAALAMKAGEVYAQKRMTGQPVDLPVPGVGANDPLRNAVTLMEVSGEAAASAETLDTMLESLMLTNPDVAKKMREVLDPVDINLLGAKAMADIFSVEEMQSMIKFFKTPTGLKLAKNTPAIMRESGKAGENYFRDKLSR